MNEQLQNLANLIGVLTEEVKSIHERVKENERRLNGHDLQKFRQVIYGDDELQLRGVVQDVRQLTDEFSVWSERLKTAITMLRIIIVLFSIGFLGWVGQLSDALGAILESFLGG